MHCNIRDIDNIIKGRINYYSYLAKDIDALASGVITYYLYSYDQSLYYGTGILSIIFMMVPMK